MRHVSARGPERRHLLPHRGLRGGSRLREPRLLVRPGPDQGHAALLDRRRHGHGRRRRRRLGWWKWGSPCCHGWRACGIGWCSAGGRWSASIGRHSERDGRRPDYGWRSRGHGRCPGDRWDGRYRRLSDRRRVDRRRVDRRRIHRRCCHGRRVDRRRVDRRRCDRRLRTSGRRLSRRPPIFDSLTLRGKSGFS
jgi:hypothetical protein